MAPRRFLSAHRRRQQVAARGQALAIAPHAFHQPFDEDLLTTEQVRKRFQLSHVNQVYRLVREYDLPRVNLGTRLYRFSPSQLQAWLDKQQATGAQPARLVSGA